jgi:hypothetical protein
MPLLGRRGAAESGLPPWDGRNESAGQELRTFGKAGFARARTRLLETCANSGCRSGWLHLWRSRSVPVFEDGWTCSPECTVERVRRAIGRELQGRSEPMAGHRHRIPLGLMLMEQGWVTQADLRSALDAQKASGAGRLGQWLVKLDAVSEVRIVRTLAQQWSCPVLNLDGHDAAALGAAMPRLFVDAFGALPLRVAGGRILYVGFEESIDPVLALALERMTGLQVECGVVDETRFRPTHARMLETSFPRVELVEAASEGAAAQALARAVERTRAVQARLVRVHDCLWLRMHRAPQIDPLPEKDSIVDLVCSVGW